MIAMLIDETNRERELYSTRSLVCIRQSDHIMARSDVIETPPTFIEMVDFIEQYCNAVIANAAFTKQLHVFITKSSS